jgi:NAD(P)H-hydrate epimerase
MGACVLASKAALRAGAGLVTAAVPKSGCTIIQTAVPEAMAISDESENYFTNSHIELNFSSIGIGPGLGQHDESAKAFGSVMEKFRKPMVIDADALNLLAAHPHLQHLIPEGSILTPHPKEFERLAGKWDHDFDRLLKLQRFAERLKSVVVLKGAFTTIACPSGNVYFNSTGNPGMATGGSGDVLTGLLTGLLAQGYNSTETARLGVFIHGLAGDLAAREKGKIGLIAGDVVDFLPLAFKNLA